MLPMTALAHSVYDLKTEQLANPVGVTAETPRFSWKTHTDSRDWTQTAYRITVATDSATLDHPDVWDSSTVGSDTSHLVPYGGQPTLPATTYWWRVTVTGSDGTKAISRPASFTTGLRGSTDWDGARWIALESDGERVTPFIHGLLPADQHRNRPIGRHTMPLLRRDFRTADRDIKQSLLYISGLGHFDVYINGDKVGDHFLDPGWTKYDREALYVAFDVTDMLNRGGDNTIGAMLGNGFYNVPNERYYKMTGSYGAPKMIARLIVRYTDGSEESIVTDGNWRVTAGPVTFSSIFGGEDYDARLCPDGWNRPGFNDSKWSRPVVGNPGINLRPQLGTQLKVRHRLPVVKTYMNSTGKRIYDFGQNFSGIINIKVKGRRGETLRLRPAELLKADGTPNQTASGDPFYFQYTIAADSVEEVWQPQFTYYGFRYAQLEDAADITDTLTTGLPIVTEVTGLHTSLDAPAAGTFSCSKPMFNDIHCLIDWAIRSNMASVLTDCPHREKLGWQEQNYLMQSAMLYSYDLSSLFPKIMNDLESSQWDNGCVPTIAPEYVRFVNGFEDTPEWGSALIICPWYIYEWYGDDSLLRTHYPAMKRYIDYLGTRADDNIVAYGLGDWYDIAPGIPGRSKLTSNGVTATATYYYDTLILSRAARFLGLDDEASRYDSLATAIRDSYNRAFFHPEGYYDRNSQTANAISLHLGLVPEGREADVLAHLIADIRDRGNALTAGDVGYRYVLRALEEGGRTDVIFDMNSRYDKPGYGWQLAHGATALTESWQAYDYKSNNHLMLGHLAEWLYSGLGGLRQAPGSTAYRHALVDPRPVGDITSASTSYATPYGRVATSWSLEPDGTFSVDADVPANTTATVMLPTADSALISDYGAPVVAGERGIHSIVPSADGKRLAVTVGSGRYSFKVDRP